MTEPVAILRKVAKTYLMDSVSVPVIRGVDILVRPAHFTVLLGPSGSGKTTLLNMIGCIDRPDQGEVEVAGCAVNQLSDDALSDFRAANIGFIFQNFNLLPVLTAYENIEYPLVLAGMAPKQRHDRVTKLLAAVGLGDRARKPAGPIVGWPAPTCRDRAGTVSQAQAGHCGRAHGQSRQPDRRLHPEPDAPDAGALQDLLHILLA